MATRRQIGERLDDLLSGRSNREVGRDLGVHDSAVSRWRGGSRLPDALLLAKICERYGASADELLGLGKTAAQARPAMDFRREKIVAAIRSALDDPEVKTALTHALSSAVHKMESVEEQLASLNEPLRSAAQRVVPVLTRKAREKKGGK